ncbi:HutD family protein [Cryobacterium sp. PH31-O1]|uniref:HutD/Ves family protein n=1 Tax=Cryobacterium sp. PH31-O1 TaxID=3046306 RepID=UPI0024B910AD|nr:HutD family protein [Cryobacterium sp. PH31-O1]MDJ0339368.1 HutD family protein [Cryobacterium sp. PH31-O1]
MSVDILRAADRVDVPWRNGAGVTSEILVSPAAGDFDWRLSIATIDSTAPFSTFAGVDRCLLALSQHGLDLIDQGPLVRLGQFESHSFAGENEVASANVTRPTLALNLMTRRGRCSGTIECHRVTDSWSITSEAGEIVVVVIAQGLFSLGAQSLAVLDAVRPDALDALTLTGVGQLAVARICAAV